MGGSRIRPQGPATAERPLAATTDTLRRSGETAKLCERDHEVTVAQVLVCVAHCNEVVGRMTCGPLRLKYLSARPPLHSKALNQTILYSKQDR